MKKYLLGIIAVVFAIVFSAFTSQTSRDPLVYFEIMNGNFVDTDLGVLTSTPFSCSGDDEDCAKGYDPGRTDVVIPNGPETWTLIAPTAEEDDLKKRDVIE